MIGQPTSAFPEGLQIPSASNAFYSFFIFPFAGLCRLMACEDKDRGKVIIAYDLGVTTIFSILFF